MFPEHFTLFPRAEKLYDRVAGLAVAAGYIVFSQFRHNNLSDHPKVPHVPLPPDALPDPIIDLTERKATIEQNFDANGSAVETEWHRSFGW